MSALKKKIIVVTGGSGLLGRTFVETIEHAGGIAVNADINCEKDIKNNKFHCDITSEKSVEKLIGETVKEYGKIDGWINNAYPRTADWGNKFENISIESWRKNVDMHQNGYFLCCQKILEQMKKQKFGSLVNISSIYGVLGPDFSIYENTSMTTPAAYAAIKGAIVNLTRYLASYYGEYNIRVNAVSPGGIFDNQPESFVKKYESKVPLKRMGTPADIAPPVVFLLSDDAAYITGHNLMVDGGWSAI